MNLKHRLEKMNKLVLGKNGSAGFAGKIKWFNVFEGAGFYQGSTPAKCATSESNIFGFLETGKNSRAATASTFGSPYPN